MERLDWELKYKEAQNCSGNGIWIKLGSDTYFKQHSSQLEPTFHWRLLLDPLSMDGFLPSIWPAFLILRKKAWGLCKSLWWSSRSKVERMHEREHLFGNPMSGDLSDVLNFMFADYRQESWEEKQTHVTVLTILSQPSVTIEKFWLRREAKENFPGVTLETLVASPPYAIVGLCPHGAIIISDLLQSIPISGGTCPRDIERA